MTTADGIAIEAIREDHVEGFRKALDVVARERRYLIFLEAPPLKAMRAFVQDMMAKGNPHFVALAGGEVVGWCDIRRHEREAVSHRGALGMGIVPGFRDKGLGTRLIATTLDAARKAGLHRVELDVYADNPRAIALYEKAGFVREGVARDAVRIDGVYRDSIWMSTILD
ncbi:GNAT family N-acetyltransferase [Ectorhizobium quercum]|uniref:GNAT family N-acetyltransferase n=1 Tax=Ectorhizobium quercum TaxID=2965071 RepID=UPI003521C02F